MRSTIFKSKWQVNKQASEHTNLSQWFASGFSLADFRRTFASMLQLFTDIKLQHAILRTSLLWLEPASLTSRRLLSPVQISLQILKEQLQIRCCFHRNSWSLSMEPQESSSSSAAGASLSGCRERRALRSAYHYINSQLREKLREPRTEGLTSPWPLQPLAMLSDALFAANGLLANCMSAGSMVYIANCLYIYIYLYMHERVIAKMILLVHVGTVNQDRPAASAWLWTEANLPALHCNSMTDLILTISN